MTEANTVSASDFAHWLRPAEAISALTAKGLDNRAAVGSVISRLNAEILRAAAEHIVWKPMGREAEKASYCVIPGKHWNPDSEWLPYASVWQTGDIYFDITSEAGGPYVQGRISYFGIRLDPVSLISMVESFKAADAKPSDTKTSSIGRPGRPLSERWKPWIAELVAYVHDNGIPEGVGSQGQEELINAVADRLASRGEGGLGRSTVQSVVQAVLDRLRCAEK